MFWQENALEENRKRGAFGRRRSLKSFRSTQIGHVFLPIATSIICTPVYLVSVLLLFKHKIAYWLPSANVISDLLTFVFANEAFFASVAVYVISLILMKPAKLTLNAVLVLRSSTVSGFLSIIFSRMSLVIGKR